MALKRGTKAEPKHYNVVLVLEDFSAKDDTTKVFKLEGLAQGDFNKLTLLHGISENECISDEQSEAMRWLAGDFFDSLENYGALNKKSSNECIYSDTYAVCHVCCDIAMIREREDSGYYDE